VILLFLLAHLSHHLVTALPVPLLPFIRDEFALNYTQASLVTAAFGIVYGASQLPAGWLADRIGPRTLITLMGIIGVAVTGFLVGLSQTYLMLIICLMLMGILGGSYHPAATAMITTLLKPENWGRALGFHMVGGGLSYFLIPLIAAGLAAVWGWRGAFIALTIPTIAFGVLLHVLLGRQAPIKKVEPKTAGSAAETPFGKNRFRRLISILIMSAFTQAVALSTVSLLPLYLVDHFSVSREVAAASISLVYSAGLWAGPVGGYLSDHWSRITMILIPCLATGPVIYLLNQAPYGIGIGAVLVFIGTTIYVNTTAAQAYIVDNTPERTRSTMLGIYFFGTMEGHGVLTPVIGYLFDRVGFYLSFTIVGAAVLAVSFICTGLFWSSRD
jgi:MFS family permease